MKYKQTESSDCVHYKLELLKCLITSLVSICMCICILVSTTYAWFTYNVNTFGNSIRSGRTTVYLHARIRDEKGEDISFDEHYGYRFTAENKYYITIESSGQATDGYYAVLKCDGLELATESLYYDDSITFALIFNEETNLNFEYYWGNNDKGAVFFDGREYVDPFLIAKNEGLT